MSLINNIILSILITKQTKGDEVSYLVSLW